MRIILVNAAGAIVETREIVRPEAFAAPAGLTAVDVPAGANWEAGGSWTEAEGYTAPAPPDPQTIRAALAPLSARQIRLVLLETGTTLQQVQNLIDAIENDDERDFTQVEWDHATEFARSHPLIDSLGVALGYTPEQIDQLWIWARAL